MTMSRWTNDKTMLLEMYKEAQCLWNPKDPQHTCRSTRLDALEYISVAVEFDVAEIKRKIKNLTGQFYRERMKCRKFKESGGRTPFISKWFAYNSLMFLKDKNRVQPCMDELQKQEILSDFSDDGINSDLETTETENHHSDDMTTEAISKYTAKQSEIPISFDAKFISPKTKPMEKENAPDKIILEKDTTDFCSSKVKRKNGYVNDDEQQQEAYLMTKILYENKSKRDNCDIFGEFIAGKLRSLKTDYARNAVEHLISNILWEANLGKHDYLQSRSQNSFSQNHSSVGRPMHSLDSSE